MNAFSLSRVVLLGLFVLTTVACDGSYYNEDTHELVTLDAAGSESMQAEEELWWLWSCSEGDYSCNCQGDKEWSWKWGGGWFPYYGWDCGCFDGFEGGYCENDTRTWDERVDGWVKGQYCEYSWASDYYVNDASYEPYDYDTWEWVHEPSSEYRSQSSCVAADCIWVECFANEMSAVNSYDSFTAEKMCNNYQGPWKDKCDFDHYEPGALAFAGPGELCGFTYPKCPEAATNNCFCGDAAKEDFLADWNDNGKMANWCPTSFAHSDGRSQPCSLNGYTFSPQ